MMAGDSNLGLRKVITVRHAVAIYISSVLGAGILVIPGLAARTAGPASLLAWVLLSLASYPFAYTFATLSAHRPDSGGIYSFARESFGSRVGTMTGWLFVSWVVTGAPAITLAAGSYIAFSFPMPKIDVFVAAACIIYVAYSVNFLGIKLSGKVQVAVVTMIVLLLVSGVVASAPRLAISHFTPFLPSGVASIGVASALIVWSYLGYENVSNIAEEFENPRRDFGRSVTFSVLLIGALYLAVAFTIVGTGAYSAGGGVTPFAELLTNAFGTYGGALVSILAVVIIFGTVNAYTAGMARVVYAAARDGAFPRFLAKVDPKTGVPRRALLALLALITVSLLLYYYLQLDVQTGFLVTSGSAILTYLIGSLAGVRLLKEKGARRALPWLSLLASIALIPFIGVQLIPSLVSAGLGLGYGWLKNRPSTSGSTN
ncbi:MAG: amino acid permease [Nitrososphaerota archaeon]|nr:amino acid permease [Nitrososphaerota archaeon]